VSESYKYVAALKYKGQQRDNGAAVSLQLVHLMMASWAKTFIIRKRGRDDCF
jgi:hypothetical protein